MVFCNALMCRLDVAGPRGCSLQLLLDLATEPRRHLTQSPGAAARACTCKTTMVNRHRGAAVEESGMELQHAQQQQRPCDSTSTLTATSEQRSSYVLTSLLIKLLTFLLVLMTFLRRYSYAAGSMMP